jgi:hypothetical protein
MNLTLASAETSNEQHDYFRVKISLPGRYMLEDKREFACRTIEFSASGVSLAAPVRGRRGERVVVYLDYIGRIEGTIIRDTPTGFALALIYSRSRREKLAEQLTYLLGKDELSKADRRHDRILPHRRHAILHLGSGEEHLVKLIDISVSGAAIATQFKAPLGTKVRLGDVEGSIIRHFETGMAIEFTTPLTIERFDENIRL